MRTFCRPCTLTRHFRRAKIKLLAKKSIETGEDCDNIPESMRNYLAIQAMDSGKPMGGNFLGRSGLMPYGSGSMMMGGDQGPQGKVGMSETFRDFLNFFLTYHSHPPLVVPLSQCRIMAQNWPERNGLDHFLLT